MNNTVFIIDDDEDVRAVTCFALEFEGIRTVALENGKKAIDYLVSLSPNEYPCLMIVDYMMPEMDGIDFINKIRESYPNTLGRIPIALSTARTVEEGIVFPDNICMLTKPLELQDLLKVARDHCNKNSSIYSLL
jgi:CheY-like chemotaxis protein